MGDRLKGTYKIYKEDTDAFLTWLVKTAQRRGHRFQRLEPEAVPTPTPRLKGKARTAARKAASKATQQLPLDIQISQLSLKDFTACAETLASARDPRVAISPPILTVASRALSLRKRYADWFAKNIEASQSTSREDHGHQYFNHWLEGILSILRPCGDVDVKEEEQVPSIAQPDLSNRFMSLEVEEPSVKFLSSEETKKPLSTSLSSKASAQDTTCTLQNSDEDRYLAIFCLYEDLNSLRQQICQMWTKYRLGSVDLVSVSVATNVALELGINVEKEFLELYPELNTGYKIMIALLRILQSQYTEWPHFTVGVGEPGCIRISKTLSEWLLVNGSAAFERLRATTSEQLFDRGVTNDRQIRERIQQLSEVPPETLEFDAGELCRAVYEEDLISVSSEFAFIEPYDENVPAYDLCSQSLRERGNNSLSALFAAQAFLDIKEIMGPDIRRGFEELICFKDSLEVEYQIWESETKVANVLDSIKELMDEDNDELQMLKLHSWQSMTLDERTSLDEVYSPSPTFKLLKEHPLHCGSLLCSLRVGLQYASLNDANDSRSILSCAHLYNAMQQAKILSKPWEDLENILSSHREGELFMCSRPENPGAMARQWLMVNGMSATLFSKDITRRLERNPESFNAELRRKFTKDERTLTTPTPLIGALLENHHQQGYGAGKFGVLRPNVNSALSFHAKNLIQNDETECSRVSCLKQTLGASSITKKVEMVFTICAHAESQILAFNYARINQRCSRYLEGLQPLFPDIKIEDRGESDVLMNFALVESLIRKAKFEPSGAIMGHVAKTMGDLIEKEGNFETNMAKESIHLDTQVPQETEISQPRCVILGELKLPLPESLSSQIRVAWTTLYNDFKA